MFRSIDSGLDRLISGCLTRDREQRTWPITEVEQGLDPLIEAPYRATTPTLTSVWGAPAGAALPPPSSARGAVAPPDSAEEMDAETKKLAVETLASFTVPERAPRAHYLSERPPPVPHDATVKMFSSAPPPSSPLQTALANAVLTEDLSPVPLSVRSSAALSELPEPSPALRAGSTPLLGEHSPPKRDRLLVARALVACVVAGVVLALALTRGTLQSSTVAPTVPTASAEAGSIGENVPVVEATAPLPRAVAPGAHVAAPPAAPPKVDSTARPRPGWRP